jgi:3-oxoacyl-[acyl-carrier protein] reductase
MPAQLEHQVAIVTGGAAGIGRAIVQRLADDGATVVVADINEKDGREVAEAVGTDKAVFQRLDVTDKSSADATVAATLERFGRLDILVNNAGIVNRAPFLEYGLDAWRTVLSVNLTGAFICGQTSARAMANAGRGRIINIASVSGQFGGTGRAAYGASKAGIISLTQTMAMELGTYGITVNAVAPGPTQVARQVHGPRQREAFLARMALKRYGQPADIAAAVAFLASADAGHITGSMSMVASRLPVCCSIRRTNADEACWPFYHRRHLAGSCL